MYIILTLEAENSYIIKWWVGRYYAAHPYMKIHTNGMMSLRKESVNSASLNQKINTKSSTEAEVKSTFYTLPQVI